VVLITGGSGTLGWTLSKMLAGYCRVVATFCTNPCTPQGTQAARVELGDRASIEDLLTGHGPEVIVHLAAVTDPDRCESDPGTATRVNLDATTEIATLAARSGCRMLFASTDLVFDGLKGNYTEQDEARPLSIYGTTKLRAEEAVLEACPDAFVFRSSLIYGFGSPVSRPFFTGVLERLRQGRRMQLFTDQRRNPILVDDLASAIKVGIERDLTGLYHIGGPEVVTRYEFGKLVCDTFGYPEDLLVPTKMGDFTYTAKRPIDCTLDSTRFAGATGFKQMSLSEGLVRLKERG
jgi:dTDP-4-dehydrorhamnose reductase